MKRIAFILACATVVAGCNRQQATGPATRPAQQPAVVAVQQQPTVKATTGPATTNVSRPPSVVLIDQKRYEFPPAILQIRNKDGQLTATLMSDDPKDAISENYHGNSFYIQMPLETTDINDLSDSPWRFSDQSGERSDSPNGIFLDGNRVQLQPSLAQIKFSGKPPMMTATISGRFAQFDTKDDSQLATTVNVIGEFEAEVREK